MATLLDFDGVALLGALDEERTRRGLSWPGVARAIWDQHPEVNRRRQDHPIAASTLTGLRRGDTTCQHAALFVQWLRRAPEEFLAGWSGDPAGYVLPPARPDRRLRWDLPALAAALDERRHTSSLTWTELAGILGVTPSQAQGVRRARFAISMGLAMRCAQWLDRPARTCMRFTRW